jgi:hypothetical protein
MVHICRAVRNSDGYILVCTDNMCLGDFYFDISMRTGHNGCDELASRIFTAMDEIVLSPTQSSQEVKDC